MITRVIAPGGERLDRVAQELYGTERGGTVEALLLANPGLAALGPIIPEGVRLMVPERVTEPTSHAYQLAWE